MKILHVISNLGLGGRQRRMAQLTMDLSRHDNMEQMVLLSGTPNGTRQYSLPDSVTVQQLGCQTNRKEFMKEIERYVKDFCPDIVHVWSEVPTVLISISLLKLKYKFKLVTGFLADGNKVNSWTSLLSYKFAYSVSEAIVSNSKAGLIAKKAPLKKSHVIYNGFDFNRFSKPIDENQLNPFYGESASTKFRLGMFARLSKAKDWEMFLDVASKFDKGGYAFYAVGDGDLLDYYKNAAEECNLKNIHFLGRRKDVEALLKQMDIVLLFSNDKVHAEGVSNSIMEAMAAGKPVIATRGGGTPEIITDGKNGYIITPGDTEAACKVVKMLSADDELRKTIGKNAVEEIKRRFLLTDMTNHYLNLYNSL